MKRLAINGDQAVALSWKQVNPDFCASYPITPQTIIVEAFSDYVADGEVDTEYVCSESEHSSMSMCIGAAAAGCPVLLQQQLLPVLHSCGKHSTSLLP